MKINSYTKDDLVVLEPVGKFSPEHGVEELNEKLNALLGNGQKRVVVDLGRTDRISSSAIRVLFHYDARFRAIGGILRLANLRRVWGRSYA